MGQVGKLVLGIIFFSKILKHPLVLWMLSGGCRSRFLPIKELKGRKEVLLGILGEVPAAIVHYLGNHGPFLGFLVSLIKEVKN